MGNSIHVHVETPFAKNIVINVNTVHLSEEELASLVADNTIYFGFYNHLCHLFSKETEENLVPFINND